MLKFFTIAIVVLFSFSTSLAQFNFDINGYLQNMHTVWAPKFDQPWLLSGTVSNRFNFSLYPRENVTVKVSLRNIFDYGQFVNLVPSYSELATVDNGYINLTRKISSGKSYLLYTNIDRLNISYVFDNFEIQLGRQRINWGINSVWTPNDIFNSSSFINFDYVEKPGSDALRMQYYFGFASSLELVGKLDYKDDLTLAGKYQFNKWEYDFQLLSGFSKTDFIFGAGWSGSISDAGFTGELTYFADKSDGSENDNLIVSSVGINYMFSNSLFISTEFLFNSAGTTERNSASSNIFDLDYSAKNLSLAKHSFFTQIQYPITPLLNASLATIINPNDGSLFLSPNTEFSLNEDIYLLLAGQFFIGNDLTEWGDFGQFYYLRIKWNY